MKQKNLERQQETGKMFGGCVSKVGEEETGECQHCMFVDELEVRVECLHCISCGTVPIHLCVHCVNRYKNQLYILVHTVPR